MAVCADILLFDIVDCHLPLYPEKFSETVSSAVSVPPLLLHALSNLILDV